MTNIETETRYKLGEFARLIGLHTRTLQRWDNERKLVAFRTATNRRYYTHAHINYFEENKKKLFDFNNQYYNKKDFE